ncbi:ribonuclease HI [Paenibacillus taihuensis]|uniref:Ribonuclease H n=1 Tax=Paenibacillus taihuensis TaxID=1156355 RepID=A0A3D9S873_9BACL|nr:ribonuclease H family protein [Paenibacillus taihuensis]REE86511.1 ribonuclease HI [Paenibacillus taihuensis]
MAKQKFYVVWVGRKPGVYASWAECQLQTNGFDDAKFKSYESRAEAEEAYQGGWKKNWGQGSSAGSSGGGSKGSPYKRKPVSAAEVGEIDYDSISVDVGTNGNPGPVEYKGVDTKTGEVIFAVGPIAKGTNNLGEFLAIVHGLAYLKKLGSNKTVYSDSVNALKWVREKAVSSTLVRDDSTAEIWLMVDRAVRWLQTNTYSNKVLKWQTKVWGEIKADYGRK